MFPTATASASDAASSESNINDLLGADLASPETEVQDVGDTPESEPETEVQDEPETEVVEGDEPEAEGDESEESEEGDEEDSGEEEFNVTDLETDFAESAYASAAKHYSKQFGKQLDPNDQGDRAMLRELMERGRKISELQTKETEEEAEEEGTEQAEATSQPVKTTQEMLNERIVGVKAYAKEAYNPVVAKEVVMPMMKAIAEFLWPGKGEADLSDRSEQQLMALTQAMTAGMAMQIADAVPQIVQATPAAVEARYPYMSKMHEMAEKEAAVDDILDATDAQGNQAYPGFDKLVESGAINRALASPELKTAVFNKDPYKNRIAKLRVAYKMAKNERVDPKMLEQASKRGRAAEQERQRRVAAGRNSPGNSNRGTTAGKTSFLDKLVGGGESRSASLFKNVGRRQE